MLVRLVERDLDWLGVLALISLLPEMTASNMVGGRGRPRGLLDHVVDFYFPTVSP